MTFRKRILLTIATLWVAAVVVIAVRLRGSGRRVTIRSSTSTATDGLFDYYPPIGSETRYDYDSALVALTVVTSLAALAVVIVLIWTASGRAERP